MRSGCGDAGRIQQDLVDHAEDGGVRADSQGQGGQATAV